MSTGRHFYRHVYRVSVLSEYPEPDNLMQMAANTDEGPDVLESYHHIAMQELTRPKMVKALHAAGKDPGRMFLDEEGNDLHI